MVNISSRFLLLIFLFLLILNQRAVCQKVTENTIDSLINLVYETTFYSDFDASRLSFQKTARIAIDQQLTAKALESAINLAW